MFMFIFTEHGITVEWDKGMRVYITLAPEYMNKVCGLCGNFDTRADNDFRARTGQVMKIVSLYHKIKKTLEN